MDSGREHGRPAGIRSASDLQLEGPSATAALGAWKLCGCRLEVEEIYLQCGCGIVAKPNNSGVFSSSGA